MTNQPTNSDAFVGRVMTSLPARPSLLERIAAQAVRIILSPVWMWICLVVLVVAFHRPIFALLSIVPELSIGSIVLMALGATVVVVVISRGMLRDCR